MEEQFVRLFPTVSRETLQRLEVYAQLLERWQTTINLVAKGTLPDLWVRHFADSAQLLDLAPNGPLRWLDLGSGAGFPGLVIAMMLVERPGSSVRLVESDGRKCAFLREVVRQAGLAALVDVDIVAERIETVANTSKGRSYQVISARALAPLWRLFEWCEPFFSAETVALLPKGRDVEAELIAARQKWRFEAALVPSRTDTDARIVVVRGLSRF